MPVNDAECESLARTVNGKALIKTILRRSPIIKRLIVLLC